MKPLRVSFVTDTDNWGGAEVWTVHHVRRAARHGFAPSVVCAEPVSARMEAQVPRTPIDEVPLARHASGAPATARSLRRQNPDVVHVNLVDPASNAATLAAALDIAPTIATLHLPGVVPRGEPRRRLAELYSRLAFLTTPSEAGAEQVHRDLRDPSGGVVVAPNGVEIPTATQGRRLDRLVPRIGACGRFTEQKGFDILLAAVRRLVALGVKVELLLAGAGREERTLRDLARWLPVDFVGWVAEPGRLLSEVDLFCLPSRAEALPLALLEAMAAGLPCVASDVGDIRARLGGAVAVVPPDDPAALARCLAALLDDHDERRHLGAAARRLAAAQFDADHTVSLTFRLLRHAAESACR